MAVAPRCKMGRPTDAATAAGAVCAKRDCDWAVGFIPGAGLAEILIPFCVMAIANGAIYPIVVARALRPFPQATGRAAALQNTLQLGLCFPASLVVSALIATPLLTTTSVMLITVALAGLGYRMQSSALREQNDNAQTETSHA